MEHCERMNRHREKEYRERVRVREGGQRTDVECQCLSDVNGEIQWHSWHLRPPAGPAHHLTERQRERDGGRETQYSCVIPPLTVRLCGYYAVLTSQSVHLEL